MTPEDEARVLEIVQEELLRRDLRFQQMMEASRLITDGDRAGGMAALQACVAERSHG